MAGELQRWIEACLLSFVGMLALLPGCALAELPPLIDRDLFFGEPEVSGVMISPDGRYLAFIKSLNGTPNIWVMRTGAPIETARPVTATSKSPIRNYFWSRDAKYILFAQDSQGDENFNIYALDPRSAPTTEGLVPLARKITDGKAVRSVIYAMPKKTPDTIYVGMNDRDKAWHDLYAVQISTGKRTLLRTNDLRARRWVLDLDGQLRLAVSTAENGDTEILRLDEKGTTRISSCTVFESCSPVQFHKDGKRFYMHSNRGRDVNLTRLVLVDVQKASEELIDTDPENRVDLERAIFSPRTGDLRATVYRDDRGSRWRWRDSVLKEDFDLLHSMLPGREIDFGESADGRLWVVDVRADVEPGETYLFDRRTKKLTLLFRALETIPRSSLAHTVSISYLSSDGLRIPAYLTLPKGVEPKQLPMVVMAHGGPWARDHWGYMAFAQFFANRGITVLQPNYRGSTGYGKAFLNAGNKQWGDKMQDDITWGVRHLVAQGIVDSRRVGIVGASYGGYAALAGVAFTSDVYTAAASWVGPSNLPMLLQSLSAFSETARRMFHERIGDPTTAEGLAQLQRQSPLNSVGRIRTPLLIIQGANDPRVTQADSDQIVVALRDYGVPVEYLVAADEGHVLGNGQGFARPVNNQAIFAALDKFLAQYLGSRHQKSMNSEVAQRLKDITVDPKGVTVKK